MLYMKLDPTDPFVKAVEGKDDVFAFRTDFFLDGEGKAADDATLTIQENGDLIIEGYAAVFEGQDRTNENFTDGAFERGIKSFLDGQATLAYHHKKSLALGKVLELREEEGKGLYMKARVDGEIQSHPEMGTYYNQIKKGTLSGLSIGGFFKRAMTPLGRKIVNMDFTEISVTPVPVHPGTHFGVISGKALMDDEEEVVEEGKAVFNGIEMRQSDLDNISWMLGEVAAAFEQINKRGKSTEDTSDAVAD